MEACGCSSGDFLKNARRDRQSDCKILDGALAKPTLREDKHPTDKREKSNFSTPESASIPPWTSFLNFF